jgi:4-amino-4-deoxy-L-arabinose transferase-like glycosyltransferase
MTSLLERLAHDETKTGHLLKCIVLVLLCLVAFAPGIGRLPATDRDESRYIQATRQMVASGDLIDIRLQDQPRYLQPAGIYWLQSLAVALSGHGDDAPVWVHRTVSIVAATLAVLACYAAGLRVFGPAAGFVAAVGLAGIFMLNFEARIAKTDATILAAALTMQAALAWVYLGVRQARSIPPAAPLIFWFAMGIGIMVKGPIVPVLGLLTIAAISIYDREIAWTRKLRPLAGLAIVVLVASPWYIAITARSGLLFWEIALGRSLFGKIQEGQQSHGFPPGYYLVVFALTMWPFALETLRGGLRGLRVARNDPRIAFCLAWTIPMWVMFEMVPTKLPHYVLPTFPAQLMLMGWWLTDKTTQQIDLRRWQVWLIRAATAGWVIVTVGLAAASIGLTPYLTGAWSVGGVVAALLALLAGWLGSGYKPPLSPILRVIAASLAAAAFAGTMTSSVLPGLRSIWPAERIAEAFFANKTCPGSTLAVTGFTEPSVVVAVGTETVLTNGPGAAKHLEADPSCAMAAVEARDEAAFRAAFPTGFPELQALMQFPAFSYTRGDQLIFTLYRPVAR